ncbi:PRD domain-containing protein [Ammoniphilus sp. YIM 78166]|uniref:PRD domain-containing protein n=1 Tax=Ammoniphilus sp. YIM 78166 TaxID=1644106 RepID=UPI00106F1380|nr:PRD domain-containing protein [Ammoniphilus sp. YIM 78166]
MAYRIHRILNNNVVVVIDEGKEKIVMGPGIAFQKKKHDIIANGKIEKIFVMEEESEKFQELLRTLPEEHIAIAEEIISYAEGELRAPLSNHIHIGLTDHLSFAIERLQQGYQIQNRLLSEIKALYKKEYKIGLWGIGLIKEKLGIEMPDDEAGHIALHIHTAKMDTVSMGKALQQTTLIQDMIEILKKELQVDIDEEGMSYQRLVSHLRFALIRMEEEENSPLMDEDMLQLVRTKFKREFECAVKMADFTHREYHLQFSDSELAYITLHIQRLGEAGRKSVKGD